MFELDKTLGTYGISRIATADITNNPPAGISACGLFGRMDTDPQYAVLSGAGEAIDGLIEGNYKAGQHVYLRKDGIGHIKLGGTVPARGYVQAGALGVGIAWDGSSPIGGRLLGVGGVIGDVVSIEIGATASADLVPASGSALASATALPVPAGRVSHVTGTTTITSIVTTGLTVGIYVLIFDGILTFTDGNNLKLAGNMTTSADDTITLAFDGTNFYEVARSAN